MTITITATPSGHNPNAVDVGSGSRHWRCVLTTSPGEAEEFFFTQGSAHTQPPTAEDLLECLFLDAVYLDDGEVSDLDPKTMRAIEANTDKLTRLLGNDWDNVRREVMEEEL